MEFNYELFEKCITEILNNRCYDPDYNIGVELSDTPGVKVIFDGFGDDGEDRNNESYAVFIHKNAGDADFVFPEHDTAWNMIIHRPGEEMCIYGWFNVEEESWDIVPPDDFHPNFPEEKFMEVLQKIYDNNFSYIEDSDV